MPILDEGKELISDLWLDQLEAHTEIERKRARGDLSASEAENLHHFTDHGYLVFSLSDAESAYRNFDLEIDRLWREKPRDLSVGRDRVAVRTSFKDLEDKDRKIGYRIKDPHSHSEIIRHFYLHPEIFRYVELIFAQRAVAFQSIYFEFGSQQGLHRDPMFVVTEPPSHLLASWIALEDVTEDCGPLRYVPGSHRLPWYEFAPDRIIAKGHEGTMIKRKDCRKTIERLCAERKLSEQTLLVPRGHVLIWHGSLLHGGTSIENPESTRKSFVVHYSTHRHYKQRRGDMQIRMSADREKNLAHVRGVTSQVIEQNGCAGIDNPLLYIGRAGD